MHVCHPAPHIYSPSSPSLSHPTPSSRPLLETLLLNTSTIAHEGTTLKQKVPAQEQDLPGLQKAMSPEPFDTSLETGSGPKPYTGVGKLRGKKALITGGE